jgi:hypothetical protein
MSGIWLSAATADCSTADCNGAVLDCATALVEAFVASVEVASVGALTPTGPFEAPGTILMRYPLGLVFMTSLPA